MNIPAANVTPVFNPASNDAVFRFSAYPFGALPDGNYRATLNAGSVVDTGGNPLGNSASVDFFVLAADANRDRAVDITDFSILASRFNLPGVFSQGDFDYSGVTDISDFSILASKFNTSLPPAADTPRGTMSRAAAISATSEFAALDRIDADALDVLETR